MDLRPSKAPRSEGTLAVFLDRLRSPSTPSIKASALPVPPQRRPRGAERPDSRASTSNSGAAHARYGLGVTLYPWQGLTPETLHFPARDLKPYAEPVDARDLKEGQLYFSLGFLDEDLVIPTLAPVVFIGNGVESGEDLLYFQDAESYREGIR